MARKIRRKRNKKGQFTKKNPGINWLLIGAVAVGLFFLLRKKSSASQPVTKVITPGGETINVTEQFPATQAEQDMNLPLPPADDYIPLDGFGTYFIPRRRTR